MTLSAGALCSEQSREALLSFHARVRRRKSDPGRAKSLDEFQVQFGVRFVLRVHEVTSLFSLRPVVVS